MLQVCSLSKLFVIQEILYLCKPLDLFQTIILGQTKKITNHNVKHFRSVYKVYDYVFAGPRFVLNPIKIFQGSFGGPTLYANSSYVSPNEVCICFSYVTNNFQKILLVKWLLQGMVFENKFYHGCKTLLLLANISFD